MKENGEMKFKGFCEVCENPLRSVAFCSNACELTGCVGIPSDFIAKEPPCDFDWPDDWSLEYPDSYYRDDIEEKVRKL